MPSSVALLLWFAAIVFLFARDHKNHPDLSPALWIPVLWFFFIGSRSLSAWLALGSPQMSILEAYNEGNALDRYSLLLLFFLAGYIVSKRHVQWSELLRENKIILFYLLFCMISVIWSEFPGIAFKRFIRFAGLFPMALLALTERSPVEAVKATLRRSSYLLISLSFLFIRWFPQFGRYYNPITYETAYCGVGGNKNELGIVCLVASLIFLWDLVQSRVNMKASSRSVDTWTTLAFLLVTVYLLRIAHSATSLFCVIIGLAIILGTSLPSLKNRPETVAYRVLAISALIAAAEVLFKLSTLIIEALGRDPTLTNRTAVWEALLRMQTNSLVGAGYESFWTTGRISKLWSTGLGAIQSHNGYLDTFLNLGLIGVFLFLVLLMRLFRVAAKGMPVDYSFGQFRLAFFVIFALFNYTEAVFPRLGPLSAIFFLVSIVMPKPEEQVLDLDLDKAPPYASAIGISRRLP